MKQLFIRHRSPHHAKNSGYSRLLDYINEAKIIDGTPSIPYRLAKVIALLTNRNAGLYDAGSVFKELELYKELNKIKDESSVVHYLNAERDIRRVVQYASQFKNTAFSATFHKPPQVLESRITKTNYLQKLDGAIAVGENQVDYLKEKYNINQVEYIPHGVDTEFFHPKPEVKEHNTLLFVGQHLRDFEALNYCVPRIAEKVKNLKVNIVMHKAFVKQVTPHSSIQCNSNLNDIELRLMYQKASALFLPMHNSTACNSILEGLACGLPIITNNVGGNTAYLSNTKNILAPPKDYDYLIDTTIKILNDANALKAIGITSREKAMTYNWNIIANRVSEFHMKLLK